MSGTSIINERNPLPVAPRGDEKLVCVPLWPGHYEAVVSGSSVATFFEGGSSNRDGSGVHVGLTRRAGINQTCYLRKQVWGGTVGVYFERSATCPTFTVGCDGIFRQVTDVAPNYLGGAINATDGEGRLVLFKDLDEGPHDVVVHVDPDSVDRTLNFFGFLLEEQAGYSEMKARQKYYFDSLLSTVGADIARQRGNLNFGHASKIFYANTSASPVKVTVRQNSNVFWTRTVAADDTEVCDFGGATTLTSMTHFAATPGVISATVLVEA